MPKGFKKTKAPTVDSSDVIVRDAYCIRCGYNLRGQAIGDRCSQCMHPVSDSVYGDYLVHAERTSVYALAESARFVRLGAACLGGIMIIALIATIFAASDFTAGIHAVFNVLFAGAMICPVLAAVGLVTLTKRRSIAYYQARYGQRGIVQRAIILSVVLLIVIFIAGYYAGTVLSNLILITWAVAPVAMFVRGVEQLMRRVPNPILANFAKMAFVGTIVCGLAAFGVRWLGPYATAESGWRDTHLGFTVIAVIGGVALGIGGYRLLLLVESVLAKAAR